MATFNVGPYSYASGASAETPQQYAGLAQAMNNAQPARVFPLDSRTTQRQIAASQARTDLENQLGQALMQREVMGDSSAPGAMIDPSILSRGDARNLFQTATMQDIGPSPAGPDFQSEFDALYNDPQKLARALMTAAPRVAGDATDPATADFNQTGKFDGTFMEFLGLPFQAFMQPGVSLLGTIKGGIDAYRDSQNPTGLGGSNMGNADPGAFGNNEPDLPDSF